MTRAVNIKRLRSPRYRPADFRLGNLSGTFEHQHNQQGEGEVIDFSGEGVALAVDAGTALYLSGDPITRLRIWRGDETFYDGEAVVRSIRDAGGKTILGLAFQNAFMDLGKVYHLDLRLDLEKRFGEFFASLQSLERISDGFKAWVADTRYSLDELRRHLDGEEARIRDLDLLTRELVIGETVDLVAEGACGQLNRKVDELNALVLPIADDVDLHQLHRSYFQHHLNHHFLESPFMARSARKPLGYAGDYEVMNMLYRDHREGATLFGRVLNVFACGLTAAKANINRITFLTERLAQLIAGRPSAAIASFGCGPAREIRSLLEDHPELQGYTVSLLDLEPRAIQYCEKVLLARISDLRRSVQVRFIRESVRELVRQERLDEVMDQQDVIVSAGLFDYFGDKTFQHMLKRLYTLLKPGGHLFIGNVSPENDARFFMEYMAEWFLHYRSSKELLTLAECLPADAHCSVEFEPLDVNLFLHVVKPAS